MVTTSGLDGLVAYGPGYILAGFLLVKVINAWTEDRKQVSTVMPEFRAAIEKLSTAVDHLTNKLERGTPHSMEDK